MGALYANAKTCTSPMRMQKLSLLACVCECSFFHMHDANVMSIHANVKPMLDMTKKVCYTLFRRNVRRIFAVLPTAFWQSLFSEWRLKMANYGFGITAAQINKLLGSEWSDEVRLNCFMAAAIADLPDAKAYAKFTALLNTLGIVIATRTKISKDQYVETFSFGGKVETALSEDDMRKAIAQVMWADMDSELTYKMLSGVTGEPLSTMYAKECVSKKNDAKFVLHRIVIGQSTVYRICPDGSDIPSIVAEALRYLAKEK
jgi:hypothetical protein